MTLRQYNDDQANGDGWKPPSPQFTDPNRTLIGVEQESWLLENLDRSKGTGMFFRIGSG